MNISDIIQRIADTTGIPYSAIIGPRRSRKVCMARFLAMGAIRIAFPHWALVDVSESLGRADHATIYHGLCRYRELWDTDQEFHRQALLCGLPQRIS